MKTNDPFSYEYRHRRGSVHSAQLGVPTEIFERREEIRKRLLRKISALRAAVGETDHET